MQLLSDLPELSQRHLRLAAGAALLEGQWGYERVFQQQAATSVASTADSTQKCDRAVSNLDRSATLM